MLKFLIIGTVFVCASTAALADSIDGDWCNAKVEHLSIKGPRITLPTGNSLTGQYGRHEFAYQVPPGETDAGQFIYLQLYGEDDMTSFVIRNNKPETPVTWTRCPIAPKTS
jgi:hypothetical protein